MLCEPARAAEVVKKKAAPRPNPLQVTGAFKTFVLDQLEDFGVTPRAMFGGVGLYHEGVFFGIIAGDVLYLKVDDRNRPDYEAAGMRPFKPYPHRSGTMQYYSVPLNVLESALELTAWTRKAVDAARRVGQTAIPPRRRTVTPRARRRSTRE